VSEQAAPQAVPSLKKHCRSPTAILKRKEKRKKLVGMAVAADEQLRARLAHTENMLKLARSACLRAKQLGFVRGGQSERAASKQRRKPGSKKERKLAASAMRRKGAQQKRRAV